VRVFGERAALSKPYEGDCWQVRDAVASLSRAENADPMLALLVCRLTASRAAGAAAMGMAMGMGVGMGADGSGSGGGGGGGGTSGFAPELGEAGVELVRTTMLTQAREHNDVWQQVSVDDLMLKIPVLSARAVARCGKVSPDAQLGLWRSCKCKESPVARKEDGLSKLTARCSLCLITLLQLHGLGHRHHSSLSAW
jgi:hypothetical protein